MSNNINKVHENYVPYFNPYINNVDAFNSYCQQIESMKDNLPPELVVHLAHEITLTNGADEGKLLNLTKECLLKESKDNYALLLSMLEKKRSSVEFFSPEIVLKAYNYGLTLEQCEAALYIFSYWECIDEILQMCQTYKTTVKEAKIATHNLNLPENEIKAFLTNRLRELDGNRPDF